ncbi:MAG: rRNA maturation RNase YbeY [Candidatus Acidiferrales bacterium]
MVINRQRRVSVASPLLEQFFARIAKLLQIAPDAATVCLVTNAQIARWNRAYRGKAKPTDVLSFPAEPVATKNRIARNGSTKLPQKGSVFVGRGFSHDLGAPTSGVLTPEDRGKPSHRRRYSAPRNPSYLGDIAIAPAVARRNAQQSGRAFDDEMRVLMLHGVLHLLGYDHETDSGQMERLELRLRRQLGIQ